MKRILFALVIYWLLCNAFLNAQNQGLDFYLYTSDHVQSIENSIKYNYSLFPNTVMDVSGLNSVENRLNFNQKRKNTQFNLGFNHVQSILFHSLSTDYKSIYDASDLEPSPYENKTASLGYQLTVQPSDSLSFNLFGKGLLRNEQDRYINNNSLYSDGYWIGSSAHFSALLGKVQSGITGSAERKKLAWEAFELAQFYAYANLNSDNLVIDANAGYNKRNEDVFILSAPETSGNSSYYSLSDTQQKNNMSINCSLQYIPAESFVIMLGQSYIDRDLKYAQNKNRNNNDNDVSTSLSVNFLVAPNVSVRSSYSQGTFKKEYFNALNNRMVEARRLDGQVAWEYIESDSLIASVTMDLQRTSFPDENRQYDNDLLNKSARLGWKHYWHDRVKIGTWIGYSQRDDVYISSILSASNRKVHSFLLQPECHILLGDRIAFVQNYSLRSAYTDFVYSDQIGKPNSFYRQVAFKYNLIFDSYPYIARSQDVRWLQLPFRSSPDNALLLDFGYAYEENQYADEKADYYELHTKNRRHTASLSLRHDIRTFFWALTPQYTWGTWQEYSALFGVAWQFNNQSMVELSISPFGETVDDIDWRSSLNLNLRF